MFVVVDSELLIQAWIRKLNGDLLQPSGTRYDSVSLSVKCLVSLAYWERLISSVKAICYGTPQAIGSFSP